MILSLRFTDCTVCLKAHLWDQYFFFLFNRCHGICQLFVNIVKPPGETHFLQLFSTKSFSDLCHQVLTKLRELLLLLCHVNIVLQNCSNAHKRHTMFFFPPGVSKGWKRREKLLMSDGKIHQ